MKQQSNILNPKYNNQTQFIKKNNNKFTKEAIGDKIEQLETTNSRTITLKARTQHQERSESRNSVFVLHCRFWPSIIMVEIHPTTITTSKPPQQQLQTSSPPAPIHKPTTQIHQSDKTHSHQNPTQKIKEIKKEKEEQYGPITSLQSLPLIVVFNSCTT